MRLAGTRLAPWLVVAVVLVMPGAGGAASTPTATSVIGLLELPSVLGHDGDPAVNPPSPVPRRPIPVFASPAGPKFRDLGKASDFQREEHTYEGESVVVYEREGDAWYRIGLGKDGTRTAWVRAEDAGTFRPIGALLTESAAYLDADWDGRLWSTPGGGPRTSKKKQHARARAEYAADVVEAVEVEGALWLHVRLYANDPCEDGDTSTDEEGWVPAYTKRGALTAWFWSRGC